MSKTLWYGAAQIVFGLIGISAGWIDHEAGMSLIITGLGTIGFRTVTAQPIK